MDDFEIDRPEFTGTFITMEFGAGGRIQQLWCSDPNQPEEGDEFQFVCPPVQFGEEFAEDYFPGTILIGARTSPTDPWILSRNADAIPIGDGLDSNETQYEYEFSLLPEIRAVGRFHEVSTPIPQVVWDVEIKNAGRFSCEIGELAFPMAFNNFYEGFPRTAKGLGDLWNSRVFVHKAIGGAASYLFAQRMNAAAPGLLVFPGEGTGWEFYSSVRGTLNTPFRWEGIPVVYAHSRAAVEREGWPAWFNDHSSIVLEPGDRRKYQTRFVPATRDRNDSLSQTLALCGCPSLRVLPGAVAPVEVGIAIEVSGLEPKSFSFSKEVESETDIDEDGGFCFVRPSTPGPLRVDFDDEKGRTGQAHLLFTESIEKLILKRAAWIVSNELHEDPGGLFHKAILPVELRSGRRAVETGNQAGSFAVECGLADALFLAEKNTFHAERDEVSVLDAFINEFIRDDIQNPADDRVGSVLSDINSVATNSSRPTAYCLIFNLYRSMSRIARTYGETVRSSEQYLRLAYRTARAMFRHCLNRSFRDQGLILYSGIWQLIDELRREGMADEAEELEGRALHRAQELLHVDYPYAGESIWDTTGFQDVMSSAFALRYEDHMGRAASCAYAGRSLSPSWWWYGSDKRFWDDSDGYTHPILHDKGELCHGYTGPANSRLFFDQLDEDYRTLPEAHLRQAFGGALGAWALVRPDGAASMGFCPDPSSRMFGFSGFTGDIGVALYEYLRMAGSYVLPSRNYGVFTFGCHFEQDEGVCRVRPWDGIGRRVVLRQIGAEFTTSFGSIRDLRLDARKRWVSADIENLSDKDVRAEFTASGIWGVTAEVAGRRVAARDGTFAFSILLPKGGMFRLDLRVVP